METVAKKYSGQADFVFVYTREAHPAGEPLAGKTTKDGRGIPETRNLEERRRIAQEFCSDMRSTRRILVDDFGDKCVQRLYGARSNPTVVIDTEGRIALKMLWTNADVLDGFLPKFLAGNSKFNRQLAEAVPIKGPGIDAFLGAQDGGPGGLRSELSSKMLEGLDLTDAEAAAAVKLITTKIEMRAKLRQQGHALEELARDKTTPGAELEKATKSFEAAVAENQKKVAHLDRKFSETASVKSRALLLAAGVLDNGFGFVTRSGSRPAPEKPNGPSR